MSSQAPSTPGKARHSSNPKVSTTPAPEARSASNFSPYSQDAALRKPNLAAVKISVRKSLATNVDLPSRVQRAESQPPATERTPKRTPSAKSGISSQERAKAERISPGITKAQKSSVKSPSSIPVRVQTMAPKAPKQHAIISRNASPIKIQARDVSAHIPTAKQAQASEASESSSRKSQKPSATTLSPVTLSMPSTQKSNSFKKKGRGKETIIAHQGPSTPSKKSQKHEGQTSPPTNDHLVVHKPAKTPRPTNAEIVRPPKTPEPEIIVVVASNALQTERTPRSGQQKPISTPKRAGVDQKNTVRTTPKFDNGPLKPIEISSGSDDSDCEIQKILPSPAKRRFDEKVKVVKAERLDDQVNTKRMRQTPQPSAPGRQAYSTMNVNAGDAVVVDVETIKKSPCLHQNFSPTQRLPSFGTSPMSTSFDYQLVHAPASTSKPRTPLKNQPFDDFVIKAETKRSRRSVEIPGTPEEKWSSSLVASPEDLARRLINQVATPSSFPSLTLRNADLELGSPTWGKAISSSQSHVAEENEYVSDSCSSSTVQQEPDRTPGANPGKRGLTVQSSELESVNHVTGYHAFHESALAETKDAAQVPNTDTLPTPIPNQLGAWQPEDGNEETAGVGDTPDVKPDFAHIGLGPISPKAQGLCGGWPQAKLVSDCLREAVAATAISPRCKIRAKMDPLSPLKESKSLRQIRKLIQRKDTVWHRIVEAHSKSGSRGPLFTTAKLPFADVQTGRLAPQELGCKQRQQGLVAMRMKMKNITGGYQGKDMVGQLRDEQHKNVDAKGRMTVAAPVLMVGDGGIKSEGTGGGSKETRSAADGHPTTKDRKRRASDNSDGAKQARIEQRALKRLKLESSSPPRQCTKTGTQTPPTRRKDKLAAKLKKLAKTDRFQHGWNKLMRKKKKKRNAAKSV